MKTRLKVGSSLRTLSWQHKWGLTGWNGSRRGVKFKNNMENKIGINWWLYERVRIPLKFLVCLMEQIKLDKLRKINRYHKNKRKSKFERYEDMLNLKHQWYSWTSLEESSTESSKFYIDLWATSNQMINKPGEMIRCLMESTCREELDESRSETGNTCKV